MISFASNKQIVLSSGVTIRTMGARTDTDRRHKMNASFSLISIRIFMPERVKRSGRQCHHGHTVFHVDYDAICNQLESNILNTFC